MLKFTDGVNVDTSGPLRRLRLKDGLYVVGQGSLIPMNDIEDANAFIREHTDPRRPDSIFTFDPNDFDWSAPPPMVKEIYADKLAGTEFRYASENELEKISEALSEDCPIAENTERAVLLYDTENGFVMLDEKEAMFLVPIK